MFRQKEGKESHFEIHQSILFFLKKFFYWSIIALQRCVSFCCTMKWISYMYTDIPSLVALPSHSTHLVITEHRAELPVLYSRFPLAIYFTHGSVFMSNLISQFIPSSPSPLCPHIHSLHLRLYSCPENRFICTIFLDSTYGNVNWYSHCGEQYGCSLKN